MRVAAGSCTQHHIPRLREAFPHGLGFNGIAPAEQRQQVLFGPRAIHAEKCDQPRTHQHPAVAESIYLRVAQCGENGLQVSRKQIVVIRVLLETKIDQRLRDMPNGVVDCRANGVVGFDAIADAARSSIGDARS